MEIGPTGAIGCSGGESALGRLARGRLAARLSRSRRDSRGVH